jgi:hypothetical protein
MIELKIPQETIDSIFPDFSTYGNRHEIEWQDIETETGEMNMGDYIFKPVHKDEFLFRIEDNVVKSPFEGYAFLLKYYNRTPLTKKKAENKVIGIVCEELDEAIKCLLGSTDCTLNIDPFTQKKQINGCYNGYLRKWCLEDDTWFEYPYPKHVLSYEDSFMWMEIAYAIFVCFEFREDKGIISFDTSGWRKDQYIHKGDTISLLLSDGEILDYTLNKKALDKHRYGFTLYQDDIDALFNNRIVSCRITYADEERKPDDLEFKNTILGDYAHDAIRYYLQSYLDEVHHLVPSYKFPVRKVKKTRTRFEFNWCYVYLMKDTSNGYYKIGISNTPEYREKTLQSEKPTIELLASTKYPTRKIAEAIESALHTAYSQQRLRGEWFKLDDIDVAAIIETLR